jgi:hypothetical protein
MIYISSFTIDRFSPCKQVINIFDQCCQQCHLALHRAVRVLSIGQSVWFYFPFYTYDPIYIYPLPVCKGRYSFEYADYINNVSPDIHVFAPHLLSCVVSCRKSRCTEVKWNFSTLETLVQMKRVRVF